MALSRFAIHDSRFTRVAAVLFSVSALILVFVGLWEWDVPLTRFVRSLYPPVGSIPNPWLIQFSDIGDRLGKGESLVILSLALLAIGYGLKHPHWKDAGRQSLIAHQPRVFSSRRERMGLVSVGACGGGDLGCNRAGHKVPASEMAHSRCGSGHRRQSDSPRVSLSDRRGRRSGSRLCYGSDCNPSLARMAYLGWNGSLPDDAIFCGDARTGLDDRASSVGSLAVSTALVGWPVTHPGGTCGPCLVDSAALMVPGLAVRIAGSRSCGTGVRDDDWFSVCHDHRAARLCCTLVGCSPWSDRAPGGGCLFVVAMLLVLMASYALKGIVPM